MCDVLFNVDKLFSVYVHTPIRDRLHNVFEWFGDIIGLPQICGVIDCAHIRLNAQPTKQVMSLAANFYNKKRFHNVVVQAVNDCDHIFGMFVLVS
jgi:hypothetical protein